MNNSVLLTYLIDVVEWFSAQRFMETSAVRFLHKECSITANSKMPICLMKHLI